MRKLILALAAVALLSAPAFASVQNVKISGSVDSTYIYRSDFDLGISASDEQQSVFITQTLLRVDADLTDQVAVAVALGNERPWNNDADQIDSAGPTIGASEIVIYQAYVTLREMLYSPLTLVVGRQNWKYGNSFVFDSTGTNNSAFGDSAISAIASDFTKITSQDAIRAILDYNPLTIEAFVSAINQNTTNLINDNAGNDNKYLYGLVGTYELGDELSTVVEAYLFWQHDKSLGANKRDEIKLPGVRISTNLLEGLNVSAEYAHQSGIDVVAGTNVRHRDANEFQLAANYSIPGMKEYDPVFSTRFTKLSGDNSSSGSTDDDNHAWDPFYEGQHGGKIFNTLFSLSDLMIAEASLAVTPMEDVRSTVSFSKLWTQTETSGTSFTLNQPDGATPAASSNDDERELGYEVDLDTTYAYTEDVKLGLSLGWFAPSGIFEDDNKDTAKQALVSLGVAF